MARKNKSKVQPFETPKTSEHFTRLHDSLIESGAYKKLSHSARTVYTLIKSEYKGDYTGNKVICPYSKFRAYGMDGRTIPKAIAELEQAGFIEVERFGLVTGKLYRYPNEYKLIDKWYKNKPP